MQMGIAIEIVVVLILIGFFLNYLIRNNKIQSISIENFVKFILKIIALLTVLMICLLGFVFYQERTVTPQDLSGIKLSMNKDEILYIMGDPLRSYASADDSYISIDKSNESNKTSFTKNNNSWQYARKGHEINIVFDKVTQKIDKIRCLEIINESYAQGTICQTNTISLGSSEEKVLDKFGNPDSVVLDNGQKIIVYKKFKTEFLLRKQIVTGVIIQNDSNN